ncbi:MAG: CDP-alcohol phosphatidyltransferase family protein [Chitinivibrionia bacterium]|nr:CDP-alcohol phosphatidyltransferase family protein [Chitinivibrionia bacterium]
MNKQEFKQAARRVLDPVVVRLVTLGIPPLLISLIGLLFSLYGALRTAQGSLGWGAVFLLLSGLCDVMDGEVARRRNMTSRFGAFIDSTLDRVSEFAYFGGIALYFITRPQGFHPAHVAAVMVALAGSVLTSYTRARAEGLGLSCSVGMMERPERIALLTLGLLLGSSVLIVALVFLAISTTLTTLQRILHVYRLAGPGAPGERAEPRGEQRTV